MRISSAKRLAMPSDFSLARSNSATNRIFAALLCSILLMLHQLFVATQFHTAWDDRNDDFNELRKYISKHDKRHRDGLQEVDYFGACLLVKDDNHFLIEWLAYHYHILPLRRLILAVDPLSQTSPSNILRRYEGRMNITQWTDDDFFPKLHRSIVMGGPMNTINNKTSFKSQAIDKARNQNDVNEGSRRLLQGDNISKDNSTSKLKKPRKASEKLVTLHRARQRHFFANCMRQLQKENLTWTALIDSDEYVVPNYRHKYFNMNRKQSLMQSISQIFQAVFHQRVMDPIITSSSQDNSTRRRKALTIAQLLKHVWNDVHSRSYRSRLAIKAQMMKSPCISMPRILIGTKESPSNEVESPLSVETRKYLNASDFLTLRWRWHGVVKDENNTVNNREERDEGSTTGNIANVNSQAQVTTKPQPGKAIVDVSRIPRKSLSVLHVLNPHRPVEECTVENTWITENQAVVLTHHYVGTYPQWSFRDDPRTAAWTKPTAKLAESRNITIPKSKITTATRSRERYETFAQLDAHVVDDSIRGWLQDFVEEEGLASVLHLLKGAGQVGVR